MMTIDLDMPELLRLRLDLKRAVRKGATVAARLVRERTLAGRDANGTTLPAPAQEGEGPATRPLARTGETIASIEARMSRRRVAARIAPQGYHTEGRSERAIAALERVGKVSAATKRKIRKAASETQKRKRGSGSRVRANALILHSQQVGAVGGKRAGHRKPIEILALNESEETQVREVIAQDVAAQAHKAEASGGALEARNVRRVIGRRR